MRRTLTSWHWSRLRAWRSHKPDRWHAPAGSPGCWELRAPNRVTLEMWMPPLGDMMLGAEPHDRRYGDVGVRTAPAEGRGRPHRLHLDSFGAARGFVPVVPCSPIRRSCSRTSHTTSHSASLIAAAARTRSWRISKGPGRTGTRRIQFPMRRASCLTATPPPPPDTVLVGADLSPDRRQLLVARGAAPNIDVYLYDASGSVVRRLTDHANFDYQPRWSPDGQRLAYVSVRENRQAIFTMRLDGSEAVQLTAPGVAELGTGVVTGWPPHCVPLGARRATRTSTS